MNAHEIRLREVFISEIAKGYYDGRKPGAAKPSEHRSASYQLGFVKGRASLAEDSPSQWWSLRQIDEAIERDLRLVAPERLQQEMDR